MSVDWTNFNYQEELKINTDRLRQACQDQPILLMKYGAEHARVRKEFADAEEIVKIIRSRLTKELIDKESKKPTGVEIEAHYRTHQDHIAAKKIRNEIEYDVNMLAIAVSAFHHRREILANLIRLLNMNYYSSVEVPDTDLEDARESVVEDGREEVNVRRRRRKASDEETKD